MANIKFTNLTTTNKRVRLIPKAGNAVEINPTDADNPTVGIDNDNVLTFCLSGQDLFSCEGATNTVTVALDGIFDFILNGVVLVTGSVEQIIFFFQSYPEHGITITRTLTYGPWHDIGTSNVSI